jgi:hypothetical protein
MHPLKSQTVPKIRDHTSCHFLLKSSVLFGLISYHIRTATKYS